MASACNNLAELLRVRGRHEEAAPLYERALDILTEAYGAKDARVAFALHNIAGFYLGRRVGREINWLAAFIKSEQPMYSFKRTINGVQVEIFIENIQGHKKKKEEKRG